MKSKNWSISTRFLHLGLVLTITVQLLISLFMVAPDDKGGSLGRAVFEAHELVGLTALCIVLAHWIWSIISHADGGLQRLFPWNAAGRQQVKSDLQSVFKGQLPAADEKGGLAGLIHGLGLLAVTGMALTGAIIFFTLPEVGKPDQLTEIFLELHEGIASFVWVYWLGHGGIGLLHHFRGKDVLEKMFSFKKDEITETDSIVFVEERINRN